MEKPYKPPAAGKNRPGAIWRLLRPADWSKSFFVLLGLVSSRAWHNEALLSRGLQAALAFALVSSAVYILNDYLDREHDRRHPVKQHRPMAAGTVSLPAAALLFCLCLSLGFGLGYRVSGAAALLLTAYLFLNIAYSKVLKGVVILDVFVIAMGFMLRILAGTWGLGLKTSPWLLLCAFMLTMMLASGKRRVELGELRAEAAQHRVVLQDYSFALLDTMLAVTGTGAVMSYALYTFAPAGTAIEGNNTMIYTVPLLVYGVFRYLYLLHREDGRSPVRVLGDWQLVLVIFLWLATNILN